MRSKEYQTFYSTVDKDKRKLLTALNMTKYYNYRLTKLNRKTNVKALIVKHTDVVKYPSYDFTEH
jgi:hypothetical protein